MVQYGSHTTRTLNYMESYLEDFHKYKDIFLEFQAYRRTVQDARNRTKALNAPGSQSAERGLEDIRGIQERSHFNFLKLHMLSHYREHVELFGSILQYSTNISELAYVHQIKEAYRASNKGALEIRMLNLKDIVGGSKSTDHILWRHPANLKGLLEIFKIEDRKNTPNERSIVEVGLPPMHLCNPSMKSERLFNIVDGLQISHTTSYRLIKEYAEVAGCSQYFAGISESILERRVEMFTCLQVPIPIFQRPEVCEIHNLRCTGNAAFGKGKIRKDWVWMSVASSEEWRVFRGRLPGRMKAIFKLWDSGWRTNRLCIMELLEAKDRGITDSSHGLLKVCGRRRKRIWVVNIRSILEIAYLFEVETAMRAFVSALKMLDPIGLSYSKFVSFCYAYELEEGGKVLTDQYLSVAIQQARYRRAMPGGQCQEGNASPCLLLVNGH
ncbi:uncharacterized protein H6S33_009783 [Morchella sextelata]|uniref:uncharacterized protein n=1 Tax=Morchella sextelata TaxID=1174677 RepID=UPI001D043B56|nr:uncharacterized protein H6S33_009783 [Morchella sextelata]KAH0602332.1 hypothetical protein H6S33_009783 [Morchella sextelata]